jgi:hypothetical protein
MLEQLDIGLQLRNPHSRLWVLFACVQPLERTTEDISLCCQQDVSANNFTQAFLSTSRDTILHGATKTTGISRTN